MPPNMPAVVNIENANSHEPLNEIKRRMFTYSEVIKMTNNFQNSLGKGGFGMVYHGFVNGSKQVAVKVLSQSSTQGYKEFKAEVFIFMKSSQLNYDMFLASQMLWIQYIVDMIFTVALG